MNNHIPRKPSNDELEYIKNNYYSDSGKVYRFWDIQDKEVGYLKVKLGYLVVKIRFGGKTREIRLHHLIWFFETGKWPIDEIDHKDRDKLNNLFNNLRMANSTINSNNRDKDSGLPPGVIITPNGKYVARVVYNGIRIHIGTYVTIEDAFNAYKAKCKELKGLDEII